ncbi:hypothetical protein [Dyella choica]|uniref:Lipoprotein n=1 Tax=Dyella choica TaxID=1927959 RepID=A0A432M9D7_9GAMM|nr:hypothetical protein [Dyella choica]RUL78223.1 hypothetical protein EKH80_05125 [Dyella choica]
MFRSTRFSASIIALCVVSLSACAWPFSGPVKDIRVVTLTHVDLKDQPQIEWMSNAPRPSRILTRIDFTTATDLLALARRKEFNVTYAVGACNKRGVVNSVDTYGGVFWDGATITPYVKDIPGYAAAVAKGGLMTYHVYVLIPATEAGKQLCFTLAGGNMLGGHLRSNAAVMPNVPTGR